MKKLAAVACIALVLLWPLAFAFGQAAAPPPVQPVIVPTPTPEPLGPNVTTFTAGGALLAAWEFFRRVVLPRLNGQPAPPPPPPVPAPGPPPGGSQVLELLRLVLERLLQPQPPLTPFMQAMPGTITIPPDPEPILPPKPPDWAQALLEEVRALRGRPAV